MFLDYFGFVEQPFGVTPDPRYLYLGSDHREALASLIYGTKMNRGFLALIAPPGMGKTSLLFQFLESVRGKARTAFLFHGATDQRDLMRYLLADIEVDASGKDLPEMHGMLHRVLTEEMQADRRFILVIDEAQNLSDDLLESLRLLSNFETPWKKLMQIVLAGQPQLGETLARPSMWQLRQRVSSFLRLRPLEAKEITAYLNHRLWVAGYEGPSLFASDALTLIAEHSGGIPRDINNLCFQSLSIAFALGKKQVDSSMVREAIEDLEIEPCSSTAKRLDIPSRQFAGTTIPSSTLLFEQNHPSSRSSRWLGKMAASALLLALLALGFVSGALWKTAAPPGLIDATPSVEAAALPARNVLPRAPETTSEQAAPPSENLSVVVKQGVTLRHLCLLYLDRYDPATLAQIRILNPTMMDPDHIETGQSLLLPHARLRLNLARAADSESQVSTHEVSP